MCVSYESPEDNWIPDRFEADYAPGFDRKLHVYQDYDAPIIVAEQGKRKALTAAYSMVPKRHIPEGIKPYATMNARSETVGTLRSFSKAWKKSQLCLVPMTGYWEPRYESEDPERPGQSVRWTIRTADELPFAVAGLWRTWDEPDGKESYSFTQLTVNADNHPLMNKFHKPGEEKRALVILEPTEYDDWLNCKDPEQARAFLHLMEADRMTARPDPLPVKVKPLKPKVPTTGDLF